VIRPSGRRPGVKRLGRRADASGVECFYHEGKPAVGSCRACLKGLCRHCAVALEGALACPSQCEPMARALVLSLQQTVRFQNVSTGFLRSVRGLWIGLAAVASFVGLFVVVWGLSLPVFREVALLGIPFLALAFLAARLARNTRPPSARSGGQQESAA
jgi:hypothetical protein